MCIINWPIKVLHFTVTGVVFIVTFKKIISDSGVSKARYNQSPYRKPILALIYMNCRSNFCKLVNSSDRLFCTHMHYCNPFAATEYYV